MNHTISVGPFVLPTSIFLVLLAVALGVVVARVMTRKLSTDVKPMLWRVGAAALLAARLAYVWQYHAAYFASPLDILDIRDGGWTAEAGVTVAWLYAFALTNTRPVLRKPIVLALVTSTFAFLAGSAALAVTPGEAPRLKPTAVVTKEGGISSLADFKGKPTVLNLWATWCPPCQREMPILADGQVKHPEINFVFLNQGDTAEQVETFLQSHGLALRNVLLDPKGEGTLEYGLGGLPTTLFFDSEGRLVDAQLGGLTRAALLSKMAKIMPAVGAQAPAPVPNSTKN
jgi:thiol-disulfide isomerase/thioredoxin